MSSFIVPPWSEAQVAALNRWQDGEQFHPYTCGRDGCRAILRATSGGWTCPDCDYTQDWAHAFSVEDAEAQEG